MNEVVKIITNETFDVENTDTPFGKRWGGEVISLTEDEIEAMKNGKLIALDVMTEYIVYIKVEAR